MNESVPSWMVHEILVACGLASKVTRSREKCPFCKKPYLFSFGPWHYSCLSCGEHGFGEDLVDRLPDRYHDDAALVVALPSKHNRHEVAAMKQLHDEWLRWMTAMGSQVRMSTWRQLRLARDGGRYEDAEKLQAYLETLDESMSWANSLRKEAPCTNDRDSCAK